MQIFPTVIKRKAIYCLCKWLLIFLDQKVLKEILFLIFIQNPNIAKTTFYYILPKYLSNLQSFSTYLEAPLNLDNSQISLQIAF